MNTDPLEILSAFVDGEMFTAEDLAAALTEPGSREILLDFLQLKSRLIAETGTPRAGFEQRTAALLAASRPIPAYKRRRRFLVAAAVVLVAAISVWWAGKIPNPHKDFSAVPNSPPAATRRVQLQDGVDWHRY